MSALAGASAAAGGPSGAVVGALLGLGFGAGALLVLGAAPPLRRPSLHDRLSPHLRDAARDSRLLDPDRSAGRLAVPALLLPLLQDVAATTSRWLAAVSGNGAAVRRRLEQAGRSSTVEQFRVEQVLWGLAGLAGGLLVAAALAVRSSHALVPGLAAVVLGLLAGPLGRDRALSAAVTARRRRLAAELPTVAELLALSVSAGEGAVGALERLARSSSGELAGELRRTLADARSGAPLVLALERMAARTSLPALARFVDGVVVAVERGTPLAEVLRAQAQDAREQGRRELLEAGGRKEIAMMVPVAMLAPFTWTA